VFFDVRLCVQVEVVLKVRSYNSKHRVHPTYVMSHCLSKLCIDVQERVWSSSAQIWCFAHYYNEVVCAGTWMTSVMCAAAATAAVVIQPKLSLSLLKSLHPGFSLYLALVFKAHVPRNATASSLTPSFHLFLGFPTLLCCELFVAGLSLVCDVPPFWLHALPTAIF